MRTGSDRIGSGGFGCRVSPPFGSRLPTPDSRPVTHAAGTRAATRPEPSRPEPPESRELVTRERQSSRVLCCAVLTSCTVHTTVQYTDTTPLALTLSSVHSTPVRQATSYGYRVQRSEHWPLTALLCIYSTVQFCQCSSLSTELCASLSLHSSVLSTCSAVRRKTAAAACFRLAARFTVYTVQCTLNRTEPRRSTL